MTKPANADEMSGVYLVTFDPTEAREIVEKSLADGANFRSPFVGERRSLAGSAEKYRDAMARGRWHPMDAAPIRLSSDWSTCSDGLNRLAACWRSGVPLTSVVILGAEYAAGRETDRGKTRSVAQILQGMGVKQSASTASCTRLLLSRSITTVRGFKHTATLIHVDDVVELYEAFADEISSVQGRARAVQLTMNVSAYAAVLVTLYQWGQETVDAFHESILAKDLQEGDPVMVMRLAASRQTERTGKRWSQRMTFACLSKAFNQSMDGVRLQQFRQPVDMDTIWPDGVDPAKYLIGPA